MAYYLKIGETQWVSHTNTSTVETDDFAEHEQVDYLSPGNYLLLDEKTLARLKATSPFFNKWAKDNPQGFDDYILDEFNKEHGSLERSGDEVWDEFIEQVFDWADACLNHALDDCKAPAIVAE